MNIFLTPVPTEILVSVARDVILLVCVIEVNFICVGSPHIIPGITFPKNCCTKAELAILELQDQPLFGACEYVEGFGQLK